MVRPRSAPIRGRHPSAAAVCTKRQNSGHSTPSTTATAAAVQSPCGTPKASSGTATKSCVEQRPVTVPSGNAQPRAPSVEAAAGSARTAGLHHGEGAEKALEELLRSLGLDWHCSLPAGALSCAVQEARGRGAGEPRVEICIMALSPQDALPVRTGGGFNLVPPSSPSAQSAGTVSDLDGSFRTQASEAGGGRFRFGVHLTGKDRTYRGDRQPIKSMVKQPPSSCRAFRVLSTRPTSAGSAAELARELQERGRPGFNESFISAADDHAQDQPPPLVGAVSRLLQALGLDETGRWCASSPEAVAGSFDGRRAEFCFLSVPLLPPLERRKERSRECLTVLEAPRKEQVVVVPVDTILQRVPRRNLAVLRLAMQSWRALPPEDEREWCVQGGVNQAGRRPPCVPPLLRDLEAASCTSAEAAQLQAHVLAWFRRILVRRDACRAVSRALAAWRGATRPSEGLSGHRPGPAEQATRAIEWREPPREEQRPCGEEPRPHPEGCSRGMQAEPFVSSSSCQTALPTSEVGLQVRHETRDGVVQMLETVHVDMETQVEREVRAADVQAAPEVRVSEVQTEVPSCTCEVQTDESSCDKAVSKGLQDMRESMSEAMAKAADAERRLAVLQKAVVALRDGKGSAEADAQEAGTDMEGLQQRVDWLIQQKSQVESEVSIMEKAVKALRIGGEQAEAAARQAGDDMLGLHRFIKAVVVDGERLESQMLAMQRAITLLRTDGKEARDAAKEAGDDMSSLQEHVQDLRRRLEQTVSEASDSQQKVHSMTQCMARIQQQVSGVKAASIDGSVSFDIAAQEALPRQGPPSSCSAVGDEVCTDIADVHEVIVAMRRGKERSDLLTEDLRSRVAELTSSGPLLELILLCQGIAALARGEQLAELTAKELGGNVLTLQRQITALQEDRRSAVAMERELRQEVEVLQEKLEATKRGFWKPLPRAPRGLFLFRSPTLQCETCGGWAPQELEVMERVVERSVEVECPVPAGIIERRALAGKETVQRVYRATQTVDSAPLQGELTLKPPESREAFSQPLESREAFSQPPESREAFGQPPESREAYGRPPESREAYGRPEEPGAARGQPLREASSQTEAPRGRALREAASQTEKLHAPDRLRGLVEESRCSSTADVAAGEPVPSGTGVPDRHKCGPKACWQEVQGDGTWRLDEA